MEFIKTCIRIRPPFDSEARERDYKKCVTHDINTITINYPVDSIKQYSFDNIFPEYANEEEIYNWVVQPAVSGLFQGVSATIFVYGQTGTGKTHTLGLLKRLTNRSDGIVPRVVRQIFEKSNSAESVNLSFMQLYNDNIYDWLNAEETTLTIREDPRGEIFVKNLIQVPIQDYSQASNLINAGLANRVQASQNVNETSSRSHILLSLEINNIAKLTLVDLAGSERVRKTSSNRIEETKSINSSLSALGKVINCISQGDRKHVPFRESKLTRLLQPSLSNGSRVALIATIGPSTTHGAETLSTLQFASRCKDIAIEVSPAKISVQQEQSAEIAQRDSQIRQQAAILAEQRAMAESMLNMLRKIASTSLEYVNKMKETRKCKTNEALRNIEEKYKFFVSKTKVDQGLLDDLGDMQMNSEEILENSRFLMDSITEHMGILGKNAIQSQEIKANVQLLSDSRPAHRQVEPIQMDQMPQTSVMSKANRDPSQLKAPAPIRQPLETQQPPAFVEPTRQQAQPLQPPEVPIFDTPDPARANRQPPAPSRANRQPDPPRQDEPPPFPSRKIAAARNRIESTWQQAPPEPEEHDLEERLETSDFLAQIEAELEDIDFPLP